MSYDVKAFRVFEKACRMALSPPITEYSSEGRYHALGWSTDRKLARGRHIMPGEPGHPPVLGAERNVASTETVSPHRIHSAEGWPPSTKRCGCSPRGLAGPNLTLGLLPIRRDVENIERPGPRRIKFEP